MAEAKYPFASVPLCDGVIYQPTESSLVMFGVSGVQVLRPGSGTTSNPGELHSLCFQGCKLVAFSWFIAAGINYWLRAAFQSCFFLLFCWSLSLSLLCFLSTLEYKLACLSAVNARVENWKSRMSTNVYKRIPRDHRFQSQMKDMLGNHPQPTQNQSIHSSR